MLTTMLSNAPLLNEQQGQGQQVQQVQQVPGVPGVQQVQQVHAGQGLSMMGHSLRMDQMQQQILELTATVEQQQQVIQYMQQQMARENMRVLDMIENLRVGVGSQGGLLGGNAAGAGQPGAVPAVPGVPGDTQGNSNYMAAASALLRHPAHASISSVVSQVPPQLNTKGLFGTATTPTSTPTAATATTTTTTKTNTNINTNTTSSTSNTNNTNTDTRKKENSFNLGSLGNLGNLGSIGSLGSLGSVGGLPSLMGGIMGLPMGNGSGMMKSESISVMPTTQTSQTSQTSQTTHTPVGGSSALPTITVPLGTPTAAVDESKNSCLSSPHELQATSSERSNSLEYQELLMHHPELRQFDWEPCTSVRQIYQRFYHGLGNTPSVIEMEERYGTIWRSQKCKLTLETSRIIAREFTIVKLIDLINKVVLAIELDNGGEKQFTIDDAINVTQQYFNKVLTREPKLRNMSDHIRTTKLFTNFEMVATKFNNLKYVSNKVEIAKNYSSVTMKKYRWHLGGI